MLIGVVKPALQRSELKQLDSPVEVKLAHGVGFVNFDGLDRDVQALRDLLVAVPLRAKRSTARSR